MPYIDVDKNLPGIRSLMAYRPETAEPSAHWLKYYYGDDFGFKCVTDRELIGTYVSYLNDCFYCHHSHGEIAICYLNGDRDLVNAVSQNYKGAPISDKLKSLITNRRQSAEKWQSRFAGRYRECPPAGSNGS